MNQQFMFCVAVTALRMNRFCLQGQERWKLWFQRSSLIQNPEACQSRERTILMQSGLPDAACHSCTLENSDVNSFFHQMRSSGHATDASTYDCHILDRLIHAVLLSKRHSSYLYRNASPSTKVNNAAASNAQLIRMFSEPHKRKIVDIHMYTFSNHHILPLS